MAAQVDRDAAVEHVERAIERIDIANGAARQIDVKAIQPPEFGQRCRDERTDRFGAGAVNVEPDGLAAVGATGSRGIHRPFGGNVTDDDRRTFGRQPLRGGSANAAPAAGDGDGFPFKTAHQSRDAAVVQAQWPDGGDPMILYSSRMSAICQSRWSRHGTISSGFFHALPISMPSRIDSR